MGQVEKSQNLVEEVNDFVNELFGDDKERAEKIMEYYLNRWESCGCKQCENDFWQIVGYYALIFTRWEDVQEQMEINKEIQIYIKKND